MIKVWVLVALVNSGHLVHSVIPTLEFNSSNACEAAITKLVSVAGKQRYGSFKGYCVEIEK